MIGYFTPDPSGVHRRREASRHRREARRTKQGRYADAGSSPPLKRLRWHGTLVGDCPHCGRTLVVGMEGRLTGTLTVACTGYLCTYEEAYDYRELIA